MRPKPKQCALSLNTGTESTAELVTWPLVSGVWSPELVAPGEALTLEVSSPGMQIKVLKKKGKGLELHLLLSLGLM